MVNYAQYNVDPFPYQQNAMNTLARSVAYRDQRRDIERSNIMAERQMQNAAEQQQIENERYARGEQRQIAAGQRAQSQDELQLVGVQADTIKRALQNVNDPMSWDSFKGWMNGIGQTPLGQTQFFNMMLNSMPEDYNPQKVKEAIANLDTVIPKEKEPKQGMSEAELTQRAIQGDPMAQKVLDRMTRRKMQTAKSGAARINVDIGGKSMVELGREMAKGLVEERKDVEGAVRSLENLQEAKNLLDSGMITGTGAEFLTNAGNLLASRLGFQAVADPVANTQAFAATMGTQVGQIIKQFGSGTGLSDADREYAEKIVGGKITLNEHAIRKLFAINEKAYRNVIRMYNKKAAQAMKQKGAESLPYDLRVDYDLTQTNPILPKNLGGQHQRQAQPIEDSIGNKYYDIKGFEKKYGPPPKSGEKKPGYGIAPDGSLHRTDEFKLPGHITFSSDSKYSNPGQEGGIWSYKDKLGNEMPENKEGGIWHFRPSKFNLSMYSPQQYKEYFRKHEKGSVLDLPIENSSNLLQRKTGPSYNEWIQKARQANPGVSDSELRSYYDKKYRSQNANR